MARHAGVSRRTLLKGGLAVGSGLVVGFRLPFLDAILAQAQGAGVFAPNQWLRIDRDGVVTIINSVPEMGQGSMTTMPMIVADELDAEWDRIRVEAAPRRPEGLRRTRSPASSPTAVAAASATIWSPCGRPARPRARCSARRRPRNGASRSTR